jgi:serine/threonine-protein kinase
MPSQLLPDEARQQQLRQASAELERCVRAGENRRAEEWLNAFPALADHADLALELIYTEFVLRERLGQKPEAAEWYARFPQWQDDLRQLFEVHQLLGPEPPRRTDSQSVAQCPTLPQPGTGQANALPRLADYETEGEIGRGGMGVVYKVRQPRLHRSLAVKVLLESHQGQPEFSSRFMEEAQVMGQLQHPGVPPVHEVGALDDGRPFFAMKLIQGQTLAALLEARASPAEDPARFLAVFEQVCQTVAYAHARGVVHRDLKPANIMVGAFGEIQVMDWGLAKVLAEDGSVDETSPDGKRKSPAEAVTLIRTGRSEAPSTASGRDRTQAGSVLGTPAYMSPEQARGDLELIDERADVFGLGAILCEILTGQPPFPGRVPEALRRAQTANLEDAHGRLDHCGMDAELIALGKRCLAPETWDRPRDARVVAEKVTAYQHSVAERARRAEVDRAAAEARTEEARSTAKAERRARRWLVGLAAAVLLLAGGLGWLLVQCMAAVQAVEAAVADAEAALQRRDWTAARAALDRAEAHLAGWGFAQSRDRLDLVTEDLAAAVRLEEIQGKAESSGPGTSRTSIVEKLDAAYGEAFRKLGIDLDTQTPAEAAARIRGRTIPAELATALDTWANVRREDPKAKATRWQPLLEAARLADDDATRNKLRAIVLARDWKRLKQEAKAMNPAAQSPRTLVLVGQYLSDTDDYQAAVDFLRQARRHHPDDYLLNSLLGRTLYRPMRPQSYREAVIYFSAAQAVRPRSTAVMQTLANAYIFGRQFDDGIEVAKRMLAHSSDAGTRANAHDLMGVAWRYKGDPDRALAEQKKAVQLVPDAAGFHHNLAVTLKERCEYAAALAACRQAIKLAGKDPVAKGLSLGLRGQILFAQGKSDESAAVYRQSLAHRRNNPASTAMTYMHFADALRSQQNLKDAVAARREAIRLDPGDPEFHTLLGNDLRDLGRPKDAIAEYRKALRIAPTYAAPLNCLAMILQEQGQKVEAETTYRIAIQLKPESADYHFNLGLLLVEMNRPGEAIKAFQESLRLDPKLAGIHVDLAIAQLHAGQLDVALKSCRKAMALDPSLEGRAQLEIGNVLHRKRDCRGAVAAYRRCLQLDPKDAMAWDNLGWVLQEQEVKSVDEAIAAHRIALELKPDLPFVRNHLALALLAKNRLHEGLVFAQEGIARAPTDPVAHYLKGRILKQQGKLDQAAEAFRRAIRLSPFYPAARLDLAFTLRQQGRFTEALAAFQIAHEFGSRFRDWHEPSEQWLRQAEKQVECHALLDAVLKGKWQPAGPLERIEFAQVAKLTKRFAGAVRLYEQAFAEDPQLADKPKATHRYAVACYAARAGCGEGDGARLDPKERSRLRHKALDWLRADLAKHAKGLDRGQAGDRAEVQKWMEHWQNDSDLTGVREPDAVAKLPADEKEAWRKLWAEVETLLTKAKKTP